MLALLLRAFEFTYYSLLLRYADWVSALPRETQPDAMRLYRENLALKAQLQAMQRHLAIVTKGKKPRIGVHRRAAEVFAYLLTRGSHPFHRYYLTDTLGTVRRWATVFRSRSTARRGGGRPPTDPAIVELVLTLKLENPSWGQRRIREELRRMGIKLTEPTIARILSENGFPTLPSRKQAFEILHTSVRDALWALDFFAVKTLQGKFVQVLLIIDIATRELMDLRVHEGWDVDAAWTVRALNRVVVETGRKPEGLVHDHGLTFFGQFERQMRVLEIEQRVTPAQHPWCNCYAESAIASVRRELLHHVEARDERHLQEILTEYRVYANGHRAHQGIEGQAPLEVGQPEAPVLSLAEIRGRRLKRRSFVGGLLSSYELIDREAA